MVRARLGFAYKVVAVLLEEVWEKMKSAEEWEWVLEFRWLEW
jgi:hypothetical protein